MLKKLFLLAEKREHHNKLYVNLSMNVSLFCSISGIQNLNSGDPK